jgi:hypothetical protein
MAIFLGNGTCEMTLRQWRETIYKKWPDVQHIRIDAYATANGKTLWAKATGEVEHWRCHLLTGEVEHWRYS